MTPKGPLMKAIFKGELKTFIVMIAPAFILFLIIIAGPILASLGIAFTNFDYKPNQEIDFVGLEHFRKIFSDKVFWLALKNNMLVVLVSVLGQIPLGLMLAYFLYRGMVKKPNFFQAMVFLPQVISTVVIGKVFKSFFDINGAATSIGKVLTKDPDFSFKWFINPDKAMIPILIGVLIIYTGYFMLLFLANMQKLDKGIVEAASIDGASEFQIFTKIIVPALAGIIVVNAILAISGSLKSFDLIFAMAPNDGRGLGEANMVLSTYMYHKGFKANRMAFGAAVSVIIVSITIGMIVLANYLGKKLNPLEED